MPNLLENMCFIIGAFDSRLITKKVFTGPSLLRRCFELDSDMIKEIQQQPQRLSEMMAKRKGRTKKSVFVIASNLAFNIWILFIPTAVLFTLSPHEIFSFPTFSARFSISFSFHSMFVVWTFNFMVFLNLKSMSCESFFNCRCCDDGDEDAGL